MRMSETAKIIMQHLADEYARQHFGNYKTWTFSAGTSFPELEALDLIEMFGIGRVEFRFTDAGHRWAMANYQQNDSAPAATSRGAVVASSVPSHEPTTRRAYDGPVPDLGTYPKRTLLLGAGFTKNWGGFLAKDIWSQLHGRVEFRGRPAIQAVLRDALGNFEQALHLARRDNTVSEEDREILESAVVDIFRSQERTISHLRQEQAVNNAKVQEFLSFFGHGPRFMGNMFEGIDSGYIFTVNQDWLVERLSVDRHIFDLPVVPGIPVNMERFSENHRPFDENDVRLVPDTGSGRYPPVFKGNLNYIKMHGGFDLRTRDNRRALIMGAEKSAQIDQFELLTLYGEVFEQVLSTDGMRLMTIGYGFGDAHVNGAIARAVRAHGLQLFVIDVRDVAAIRGSTLHGPRRRNDF